MLKSVRLSRMLAALTITALLAAPALAWPPGGNGGGNGNGGGGGEDPPPPPEYNFPPLQYEVDLIDVPGMGMYYDTNDYGVTAVSMRPNWDPFAPTDDPETPEYEGLRTSHLDSAAALIYHPSGTHVDSIVYLDNAIDPSLPYDFGSAWSVNNSGEVVVWGWLTDDAEWLDLFAFLLTPNPDAATDGYAYDVVLLPLPAWATNSSPQKLTEAGDVEYSASASGNLRTTCVRYADGSWVDLLEDFGAPDPFLSIWDRNSDGTIIAKLDGDAHSLYLLPDGSTFYPTVWNDTLSSLMERIADTGYAVGYVQTLTGYRKHRGQTYPVYIYEATFFDPSGVAYKLSSRMNRNSMRINEQLFANPDRGNQLEPVVVDKDLCLNIPGYDGAFVSELMNETEQLELATVFDGSHGGRYHLTTPRFADGTVDYDTGPSMYCGTLRGEYPDGTVGFLGILSIRHVTP